MAKEREVNTVNYSPLRYPGGKSRLAPFISLLIQKSKIETPIYVEPFAGGAGVALSLLLNSAVDEIVINDYDKAIYSVWRALLTETDSFIKLIEDTPLSVDEWRARKRIYDEQELLKYWSREKLIKPKLERACMACRALGPPFMLIALPMAEPTIPILSPLVTNVDARTAFIATPRFCECSLV